MRTGPVAERIEQIRAHMLREQRGEIGCDHSRTHREELLGYIDTLAWDLEDKTNAYDTLLGQFDQQRELCADRAVELAKLEVAAETEDEPVVHGMWGGHYEPVDGGEVYVAACGTVGASPLTGLWGSITCDGCVEALSDEDDPNDPAVVLETAAAAVAKGACNCGTCRPYLVENLRTLAHLIGFDLVDCAPETPAVVA